MGTLAVGRPATRRHARTYYICAVATHSSRGMYVVTVVETVGPVLVRKKEGYRLLTRL